jgi:DNA-binding GntR family transcriptional regulator
MITPTMQSNDAADGSMADRIAQVLSERIMTGVLAPGAPVRQDHVAAEFRASHVPVREAFRTLEAQGLLISQPRRGVRVAPLDPSTVLEVTEMRAALETLALRHAVHRMNDADLDRAARAVSEGEKSADIAVWERANRDFHRAITAPCGMPRLLTAIEDLHRVSARFLFATWKQLDWQPRSSKEHAAILARIRAGDIGAATLMLGQHIIDAGGALRHMIGEPPC